MHARHESSSGAGPRADWPCAGDCCFVDAFRTGASLDRQARAPVLVVDSITLFSSLFNFHFQSFDGRCSFVRSWRYHFSGRVGHTHFVAPQLGRLRTLYSALDQCDVVSRSGQLCGMHTCLVSLFL
jgi:hypothetical protein